MRSFGIRALVFLLAICLCFPVFNASATDSNAVSFSLNYSGNAFTGGEIIIKITASKPSAALEAIEFTLSYESDFVSPVITKNSETNPEMDKFILSLPEGWEQMCSHSSEKEMYNLRFVLSEGEDYLDESGELVLEIPFKVKAAGSFDFNLAGKDIIAVSKDDALTLYSGIGDKITVAAASDADKLGIKLRGTETAISAGTYYLDIDAVNLGDTAGLVAFEFRLDYDKNVFSPVITKNTEDDPQMDAFIVSSPKNNWEQICILNQTEGYYILRFAAVHSESKTESEILTSGATFSISVPFKVIGAIGRSGGFTVSKASVIGIDNDSTIITGVGDSGNVTVVEGDALVIPTDKYPLKSGIICGIREKTPVSEFLSDFGAAYIIDSNGNRITDGYIKTDYILTNGSERYKLSVLGDINRDGLVDKSDYVLLKRFCMGTVSLSEPQIYSACIVNTSEPDSQDYVALKRHCFGTYDIYR